jgi:hypothetical protein
VTPESLFRSVYTVPYSHTFPRNLASPHPLH